MRRRLVTVFSAVVLAAGSLVAVGLAPAGGVPGAGHPRLQIDVVVNGGGGFPQGSLQIHRECSPVGNAASADSVPFTASTVDLMTGTTSFLSSSQSCTVSVLQSGGMSFSFGCTTADTSLITCSSNDMVTWVNDGAVDPPLRTATITVTFEPPPQPIPTTTITATFTG